MSTPVSSSARQSAILNTKQLLEFIKPISVHSYWNLLAKDPRFPKPVMGGNGAKALHSTEAVDNYLREAARTGFMRPDGTFSGSAGSAPK